MSDGSPALQGREEGVTLIEVLIAVLILSIVMLPGAWLIGNSTMILGATKAGSAATQVAGSELNQISGRAKLQFPPQGTGGLTLKSTTWKPSGAGHTVTVGSTKYLVYEAGGWCGIQKTATGSYNWQAKKYTSANGPSSYFVVIKVVWGPGQDTSTTTKKYSVVESRPIVGTGGTPPVNGATTTCPLGLA